MQHEHLVGLLKELKLGAMSEQWDEIVVDGIRRKRGTLDILERLLTAEHTARTVRSIQNRISQAKFPQHRCLADFDFEQSLIHRPALELLLGGDYIRQKRNVVLVGGPGTGKTHIATALGIEAMQGFRVRFWNVLDLVNNGSRQRRRPSETDRAAVPVRFVDSGRAGLSAVQSERRCAAVSSDEPTA